MLLGSFALGGTLAFAVIYSRELLRTSLVQVAAAAGMRLTPGDITCGLGFLRVIDVGVEIPRIPGVKITVKRLDVDFEGWSPKRIVVSGIHVTAKGQPVTLYEQAGKYAGELSRVRFPTAEGRKPPSIELQKLDFDLESESPLLPNVKLVDLRLTPLDFAHAPELTLRTAQTRVGDRDFPPLALRLVRGPEGFTLTFGEAASTPVTLTYQSSGAGQAVGLSFRPTTITELLASLGQAPAPIELGRSTLEGQLLVHLDAVTAKASGTLEANLSEFTPPHPPELAGYKFEKSTHLTLTFSSSPLYTTFELPLIKLTNGDLEMRGNGRVERQDLSAHVVAELSTLLSCVTLAKGFATTDLGGTVGAWAAKNASKTVRGSVSVKVQIDADTRHPADAKVVKRVGIGCGLRPLALVDWLSLGLPPVPDASTVDKLLKRVPKNVSLAEATRVLPTLDELIDVNLKAAKRSPALGIPPLVAKRPAARK